MIGRLSYDKGERFEYRVLRRFTERGWRLSIPPRSVIPGVGEVDLTLAKSTAFSNILAMVECKNKEFISLDDFASFYEKYKAFRRRKRNLLVTTRGFFVYEGNLSPQIYEFLSSLPKPLRDEIKIISFDELR